MSRSKRVSTKYEIVQSKKCGRYMVAARDVSAGDLILQDDPLAVGPSGFSNETFCFACMRPLPAYRVAKTSHYTCSKCNVAPLCNRACENATGNHSSLECRVFSEKRELYRDNIEDVVKILIHLRLWLLGKADREVWDKLEKMEAHLDERRGLPVWMERQSGVIEVFRKLAVPDDEADDESLQRLCGVIDVNTFELRCPSNGTPAVPQLRGLYPKASLMIHACRPAAHLTIDSKFHMRVYAASPISAGQPVSFNYTSSFLGTIERQEHLQQGKYFRCDCPACKDPWENGSYLSCLICPRCKKDYVAIQSTNVTVNPYGNKTKWQCRTCKRIYRGCLVKTTINLGKDLVNQLTSTDSYKVMERLLGKLSRTFHTNHAVMLSLKQRLISAYQNEMLRGSPPRKILLKMLQLCNEMIDVLEIVEPGISRLKGILLYELHLPIAILANREYTAREITADELVTRLQEAREHLRRGLSMLLLEPADTPEGILVKRGLQEMRILAQSIEDAKAMVLPPSSKPNHPNNDGRHRRKTAKNH